MSCCSAQNKTRVECWPARQWGKLTVRPGTQPDFLEMQSFTRSEWRPRKSARGLEREADARINLSAALEIAAEDVFGIEPKIGIAAQRQVGANTGVIIGYTEEELISSFLEDDMDYVVSQIERGDTAIGLPHADVYGDAPGLKPVPAQFQDCPFGFTEITEAPAVFVWRRAWQGGSLMIVRDQEGFEEKEQELFILMLAVLLVVFLVGAAAGKRLAVQVMRPVEKLAAAVRAASSQNTWKPLPKELITRDEVGNLAAELSASMHRLFKALKREKAFTGDVSHELRTPLTVIETSVELLKLTELTAAQQRQVDKIERSSKMMHELVEGFLAFARLSENAGSDRVSDVLQAVGRLWIPEAAKAGRQLVFRQEDCCPGSFSPLLLSTVVSNLVKNALTYSHEGEIKVTETSTGIVVADHGDPIPPAEQKRIFEPFVRGKASADIEQTGFGLGLSIVWRICMRMGWQVNLASGPDGNAFTVTLVSLADAAEPVRRSDELG